VSNGCFRELDQERGFNRLPPYGGAGINPWRSIISRVFAGPGAASDHEAISRKNSGPS